MLKSSGLWTDLELERITKVKNTFYIAGHSGPAHNVRARPLIFSQKRSIFINGLVDFMFHIGSAFGRSFFCLERWSMQRLNADSLLLVTVKKTTCRFLNRNHLTNCYLVLTKNKFIFSSVLKVVLPIKAHLCDHLWA
jgi:hypothetical protein